MNPVRWLIVGIGNESRGDDGVGKAVCEQLRAKAIAALETLTVHQLTPELAEPISRAAGVIFVDADISSTDFASIRPVGPESPRSGMTHAVSPESVIMLVKTAFGRSPPAWLLSIPIDDIAIHVGLSLRARAGVDQAVAIILGVLMAGAVTSETRDGEERLSC
ncbi:MAG: hydrogenase maturation protease [Gemmataceae bacterium]|nr:hydrogenase maturation protease [Gemmataceae bacterium]